ncbi:MAG TPA: ATP-dependent DNA helicase, partial [Trinickia sp.]|nr:ATP-dependent DNA helicase [Trinickia sp.]
PFWLGEAPGRSDELSAAVARLRTRVEQLLSSPDHGLISQSERTTRALGDALQLNESAAQQIVDYLARARAALTVLPSQNTLVMERFFDESGGTQLVIHSPFGSRINRAWGLALRKRFCRTFNFELQAAATEDAIVLSLTGSHSFTLDEVWRYLRSGTAEHLLIQALLDAPLFNVRWRWNATTSLALPRFTGGRKTAPQLQRMKSEDLLAAVFPDQVACLENVAGEREPPHHPLVDQTIDDCLHEAMDCDGWLALLRRIEQGRIALVTRELTAPSPLAAEILNARPYAFLDDAPLEERRTQAVLARRWSEPQDADDIGALDADAIACVCDEAWPQVRNADEMHEALTALACSAESEASAHDGWPAWLDALAKAGRATRMLVAEGDALWLPVERIASLRAIYPDAVFKPRLTSPKGFDDAWERDDAVVDVVRARLTGFGPLPVSAIARPLALPASTVATALVQLESEGYVMRGRFTPGAAQEEWCERHLLARIHRYTIRRLRREIEPVERADFMRFLLQWQRVAPDARGKGRDALAATLAQLEGFEASAVAWEDEILPARLADYAGPDLDELCRSGKFVWTRLIERASRAGAPVRATPIVLLPRRDLPIWHALTEPPGTEQLSPRAQDVLCALTRHGAMFFDELVGDARLLPVELEAALGELVASGLVSADSFAGLRALIKPAAARHRERRSASRHGNRYALRGAFIGGMDDAGRWARVRRAPLVAEQGSDGSNAEREANAHAYVNDNAASRANTMTRASADANTHLLRQLNGTPLDVLEHVAMALLRRYGVVFWQLLEREAAWLPNWRELLRVLQRFEARGQVRGGRFVNGLSGEQFALPEAIAVLREARKAPREGHMVALSGADPLNLVGTLLPGDKVPALAGNRIVLRDGVPIATLVAGKFDYTPGLAADIKEDARIRLTRRS